MRLTTLAIWCLRYFISCGFGPLVGNSRTIVTRTVRVKRHVVGEFIAVSARRIEMIDAPRLF
jgi:hypothetical protein